MRVMAGGFYQRPAAHPPSGQRRLPAALRRPRRAARDRLPAAPRV